ncbi:MAG TPA: hypothetical protein DEF51_20565 [Myxococcales bacterium]|nr:hypothetical protein [Myxococcales bacterium]
MNDPDDLIPSRVRAEILESHDRIRARIAEVRRMGTFARNNGALLPQLTEATGDLIGTVRDHIEREHRLLVPTLRTIDAWGPERARRLLATHRAQKGLLEHTERVLFRQQCSECEAVDCVEDLARTLERDMAEEERTHIPEKLMSEFIRVDFGGA